MWGLPGSTFFYCRSVTVFQKSYLINENPRRQGIAKTMTEDIKTLIERIKKGDKKAMARIYDAYYHPMFNTAYRIINDFHFAEDIMHESFIKAFAHIDGLRDPSRFGGWLKRIVINESLQWLKKYGHWEMREWTENQSADLPQDDDTEEDVWTDLFSPRELWEAIRRLRDNYRTILSLYHIEGYDYDEITRIMGIDYQNARTMLSRARKALRKELTRKIKR